MNKMIACCGINCETCGKCPDKNTCKMVGTIWDNFAEAKESLEGV